MDYSLKVELLNHPDDRYSDGKIVQILSAIFTPIPKISHLIAGHLGLIIVDSNKDFFGIKRNYSFKETFLENLAVYKNLYLDLPKIAEVDNFYFPKQYEYNNDKLANQNFESSFIVHLEEHKNLDIFEYTQRLKSLKMETFLSKITHKVYQNVIKTSMLNNPFIHNVTLNGNSFSQNILVYHDCIYWLFKEGFCLRDVIYALIGYSFRNGFLNETPVDEINFEFEATNFGRQMFIPINFFYLVSLFKDEDFLVSDFKFDKEQAVFTYEMIEHEFIHALSDLLVKENLVSFLIKV